VRQHASAALAHKPARALSFLTLMAAWELDPAGNPDIPIRATYLADLRALYLAWVNNHWPNIVTAPFDQQNARYASYVGTYTQLGWTQHRHSRKSATVPRWGNARNILACEFEYWCLKVSSHNDHDCEPRKEQVTLAVRQLLRILGEAAELRGRVRGCSLVGTQGAGNLPVDS